MLFCENWIYFVFFNFFIWRMLFIFNSNVCSFFLMDSFLIFFWMFWIFLCFFNVVILDVNVLIIVCVFLEIVGLKLFVVVIIKINSFLVFWFNKNRWCVNDDFFWLIFVCFIVVFVVWSLIIVLCCLVWNDFVLRDLINEVSCLYVFVIVVVLGLCGLIS